jgi:Lar family restriction alleviation protein
MSETAAGQAVQSNALLACPFCLCKHVFAEPPSLGRPKWTVRCDDCDAEGPRASDESQACAMWNHRANARVLP